MNSLNKKVCFLVASLGLTVILTSCSLGLAKRAGTLEVKTNNFATTTEKISTTTEGRIASSTDDMSNWKTYSNKIIGIEFKYPPTWPALQEKYDRNIDSKPDLNNFYIDFPNSTFSVQGYDNSRYSENIPNSEFVCPKQLYDRETCEVRINKNKTKYVWNTFGTDVYGTDHTVFLSTGKRMIFFFFYSIENYNKRVVEYEKLLSSLKILE